MAPSYAIDPEAGLVTFVYTADPTFDAWRSTMEAVFADPRYRPGFHILGDGGAVELGVFLDHAEALRWLQRRAEPGSR